MGRPHKKRLVGFNPGVCYFKPRGIPMVELEEVRLAIDEREALRLADLEGFSHEDAGNRMGVSRATFGRILEQARRHVADALINGKAINVEGGNYQFCSTERLFKCVTCEYEWHETCGTGRPDKCPACGDTNIHRAHAESVKPAGC